MNAPSLTRPPRVTTACLFVGMSCLIILFVVASALSNWGSIETQEEIRKALASQPLKNSGLEVTDVMGWLRWAMIGVAAVAGVGVVFAVYTALGHQTSRIILTVICGLSSLAFLTGGLFGILPAAFSIGCGIYLWTAEASTWFALKNGKTPPTPAVVPAVAPAVTPPVAAAAPQPSMPPVPVEQAWPTAPKRPNSVLAAGLITLIGSSMVTFFGGLFLLYYLTGRDELLRAESSSPAMKWIGSSEAEIAQALDSSAVLFAVLVPLSLLAIGASIAVLLGNKSGRLLTLWLSFICVPLGLITLIGLPWSAAAIVVIIQLRKPESRRWFDKS